ncbi:hypothetical protein GCM10027300_20600 [Modestobacter lapidis]
MTRAVCHKRITALSSARPDGSFRHLPGDNRPGAAEPPCQCSLLARWTGDPPQYWGEAPRLDRAGMPGVFPPEPVS